MPDEDDFSYRGENDPYKNIERPDFVDKNLTATDELQKNESDALSKKSPTDEKNTLNNFVDNVTGNKSSSKSTKNKFNLKGKGPLGIVIALLIIFGGGLLLGGQSLMPFAIANRVIEEFNSMGYSNSIRGKFVIKYLTDNNKLSKKAISELKAQGIEVETKGKKQTFSYTDSKGTKHTDLDFNTAINEHPEFKTKFDAGTKTSTGQFGGWFDSGKVFARLGISRSRWEGWDGTKTGEIDPETGKNKVEEDFKKRAKNPEKEINTDMKTTSDDEADQKIPDEEGSIKKTSSKTAVEAKLKNVASVASKGTNGVCATLMAASAVHALVAAQQTSEMLNLASGYLEATQKIQAGEGNSSPMQLYNNELTTQDENGKSAMSSTGMSMLFSGTQNQNYSNIEDESFKKANTEASTSLITTLTSTAECITASAIVSGASLIVSFATGGLGGSISMAGVKLALGAGVAGAVAGIIPLLANIFTEDPVENMVGETAGNYLVAGSSIYTGKNHQASGGSPGDKNSIIAFKQLSESVLAEQAEQDRQTLSPFDTSSRYTFLGSIVYSTMPYFNALSDNTLSKTLSSTQTILTNSIANILPTSSALGVTKMITSTNHCPLLESVGGVGDPFCNPYYVEDTSTMSDSIETTTEYLYNNLHAITSDDPFEAEIVENSGLAKFRQFCGNRDTTYGLLDGNILSTLTPTDTGNNVIDGAISSAPIIGEITDITTALAIAKDDNKGYVTGENCVANSSNSYWQKEGKYYQRFLSDQRIMANASDEQTALERFDDKYYAEHPIDTSYEAILARLSGQTKEQVIAQLEELDYQEFIANYDASDRYSFNNTSTDQLSESINLDIPISVNDNAILSSVDTFNLPIYADLRQQSVAA